MSKKQGVESFICGSEKGLLVSGLEDAVISLGSPAHE